MNKINLQSNSGFTLIEIMVSLSIFMIVMIVAMGSLMITSDSSNKSRKLSFAMDNINFAMESMSRNIRMGTNYTCVTDGTIDLGSPLLKGDCNGGNFLAFNPTQSSYHTVMGYQLVPRGDNGRADGTSTNTLESYDETNMSGIDIISPEIDIQKLSFTVKGSDPADMIQPSVYILIKGAINIKGVWTDFAIQTMASQRSSEQ
jgi:type II secretory pathway pseudopilin PulG